MARSSATKISNRPKTNYLHNPYQNLHQHRGVLHATARCSCLLGRPEPPFRTGLCFTADVSFFLFRHSFSELPRPIALKLCHMVKIWLNFIIPLQKFGGLPPKKLGPKTCKISVNFAPLQTLIANISGTAENIQNRPALQTMAIPPASNKKSPVNFGPLTAWNYM